MLKHYTVLTGDVLSRAEEFWDRTRSGEDPQDMIRFSFFLGIFPFAGYFFYYTVVGRIWNEWPFINSTLPVLRGLMCAGLQWIFFATFATISALLLEFLFSRKNSSLDVRALTAVCTYSMAPMHLAALFVGVPFVSRTTTLLGVYTFLYLFFYGCRRLLGFGVIRSAVMTLTVTALFALIRQMFVFVIGF